jgi:hypothetical protein
MAVVISSAKGEAAMPHNALGFLLVASAVTVAVGQSAPDWQIHANWCANIDNGSSHSVYLATCRNSDQYDSVLACQRDAAKNNSDGGAAIRAIEAAGRQQVNIFMQNNKPLQCK